MIDKDKLEDSLDWLKRTAHSVGNEWSSFLRNWQWPDDTTRERYKGLNGYFNVPSQFDDPVTVQDGEFTLSWEENGACNCHPEYYTEHVNLPIDWLYLNDSELRDAMVVAVINRIKRYDKAQAERKAREDAEAERKRVLAKEARLKRYEELKAEFEVSKG